MKKTKRQLRWLQVGSFIGLLAPIITIVGINFKDYFSVQPGYTKVVPQYIEVGMGFILAAAGGSLLVLGKTKPLKGSRGLLFTLALVVLLKAVINDLILILTALSIGSVVYSAFQPKITDMKEIFKEERKADIHAKAIGNVMEEQQNRQRLEERTGRV